MNTLADAALENIKRLNCRYTSDAIGLAKESNGIVNYTRIYYGTIFDGYRYNYKDNSILEISISGYISANFESYFNIYDDSVRGYFARKLNSIKNILRIK